MRSDFREKVQAILDAHDEAFLAMREARDRVDASIDPIRRFIDGQDRANDAVNRAIDAALAANRAAIELLNSL